MPPVVGYHTPGAAVHFEPQYPTDSNYRGKVVCLAFTISFQVYNRDGWVAWAMASEPYESTAPNAEQLKAAGHKPDRLIVCHIIPAHYSSLPKGSKASQAFTPARPGSTSRNRQQQGSTSSSGRKTPIQRSRKSSARTALGFHSLPGTTDSQDPMEVSASPLSSTNVQLFPIPETSSALPISQDVANVNEAPSRGQKRTLTDEIASPKMPPARQPSQQPERMKTRSISSTLSSKRQARLTRSATMSTLPPTSTLLSTTTSPVAPSTTRALRSRAKASSTTATTSLSKSPTESSSFVLETTTSQGLGRLSKTSTAALASTTPSSPHNDTEPPPIPENEPSAGLVSPTIRERYPSPNEADPIVVIIGPTIINLKESQKARYWHALCLFMGDDSIYHLLMGNDINKPNNLLLLDHYAHSLFDGFHWSLEPYVFPLE
jgi:HNH endonuclease